MLADFVASLYCAVAYGMHEMTLALINCQDSGCFLALLKCTFIAVFPLGLAKQKIACFLYRAHLSMFLSKMVGRGTYPIVCGSLGKSRKRLNKDRDRKMGNNFSENEPANSICIIGIIASLLLD